MVTIGVICAMDSEFDLIREALSHGEIQTAGRCEFLSAERAGKRVVAATCGVGKVNAAVCAQMLISRFGADYVINSGVAGALSDRLRILDLVAARTVFYHDLEERLLQKYFLCNPAASCIRQTIILIFCLNNRTLIPLCI